MPNLAAIAKGRVAAANIFNMIDKDSNSYTSSNNGVTLSNVAGRIEFSEVSFAYPSRPQLIFDKLSFSISAGKTVAVVGPSGSGKSTIVSMVQRFYEPSSGWLNHDTTFLFWLCYDPMFVGLLFEVY